MPSARTTLASASPITLALFVVSWSATIVGPGVLLLVLGGLLAPALILTLGRKLWAVASATTTADARALAAGDARDLMRMDSDMG